MKTHILCLGDSNTHGYCADPNDCADHGIRFNEEERWTCRLQKALGDEYLVTEEGLSGRTTVFVDPIHESMDALSAVSYTHLDVYKRQSSTIWARLWASLTRTSTGWAMSALLWAASS